MEQKSEMDEQQYKLQEVSKKDKMAMTLFKRPTPTGPLQTLPVEVQAMLFQHLPPATQRILGATSKTLYELWKKFHFEPLIRVHMDEVYPYTLITTFDYRQILKGWTDPRLVLKRNNEVVTELQIEEGNYYFECAFKTHGKTTSRFGNLPMGAERPRMYEGEIGYGFVVIEHESLVEEIHEHDEEILATFEDNYEPLF
ncbi:uncharacterized protein LY89DRAFT_759822 [Mollisia scopiformis]|uniref:F-box domain-containing protein n=1 Tax=Mollisia scopiformis TaxID=149040 RepID=A0A194WSF0_MOLSC|nr:uncharacterized protein LY89DRAFT_759822 [Mollisia scopiformis]KUJ10890.1 hypothetical protein LY89DRAFT_759822 [Mollisia scopiformis]